MRSSWGAGRWLWAQRATRWPGSLSWPHSLTPSPLQFPSWKERVMIIMSSLTELHRGLRWPWNALRRSLVLPGAWLVGHYRYYIYHHHYYYSYYHLLLGLVFSKHIGCVSGLVCVMPSHVSFWPLLESQLSEMHQKQITSLSVATTDPSYSSTEREDQSAYIYFNVF